MTSSFILSYSCPECGTCWEVKLTYHRRELGGVSWSYVPKDAVPNDLPCPFMECPCCVHERSDPDAEIYHNPDGECTVESLGTLAAGTPYCDDFEGMKTCSKDVPLVTCPNCKDTWVLNLTGFSVHVDECSEGCGATVTVPIEAIGAWLLAQYNGGKEKVPSRRTS